MARSSVRADLNVSAGAEAPQFPPLKDAKKTAELMYLKELIDTSGGDINKACILANISRSRLYALLKDHGIDRPG